MAIPYLLRTTTTTLFLLTGIALLGACSSSSDNTDAGNGSTTRITALSDSIGSLEGVERFGYLQLSDSVEDQSSQAYATFFIAPEGTQDNVLVDSLSKLADTCVVEASEPEPPLLEDQLLNDYTSVSAGEVITLGSAAGTFSELIRIAAQDGILYQDANETPFPSPESLTASVPGDAFSAMSLTIAKPAPVAGFAVSGVDTETDRVDPGATARWTAPDSTDTLAIVTFSDAGTENGVPAFFAECLMVDDGEFTLPASLHVDADAIVAGDAQISIDGVARIRAVSTRVSTDLFISTRVQ